MDEKQSTNQNTKYFQQLHTCFKQRKPLHKDKTKKKSVRVGIDNKAMLDAIYIGLKLKDEAQR